MKMIEIMDDVWFDMPRVVGATKIRVPSRYDTQDTETIFNIEDAIYHSVAVVTYPRWMSNDTTS